MEFWEGAVLVVGGIWLVGRMSRRSASHPVNVVRFNGSMPSIPTVYPTGTSANASIAAGEPIGSSSPILPVSPTPVVHPTSVAPSLPWKYFPGTRTPITFQNNSRTVLSL